MVATRDRRPLSAQPTNEPMTESTHILLALIRHQFDAELFLLWFNSQQQDFTIFVVTSGALTNIQFVQK